MILKVLGYFETPTERIEIKTFEDVMYIKYRLRRMKDEFENKKVPEGSTTVS